MDRHIARNEGIGPLSVKSRHMIDADVTEGFRAGKGIIAVSLSMIDGRPGDACQLPEISWDFRHPRGEGPQYGIRCRARVGRLQMTEAFLRVLDNTDIAPRGDGDAARVRHLFDKEHVGAGIMRFDGGDGAGITVAHYDHIGRCVPTFLRFGTCPRVPAHFVHQTPGACSTRSRRLRADYGEARIHYVAQSKGSGHAAEPLLKGDGRSEPLHVNLTLEMKVRKLALDGPCHGAPRDAKATGAKVGPFRAVLRGIAITPAARGKNAADKIGLVQKQIVICNHDRPLDPWGKIAAVKTQPDIEIVSRLAHADVWFSNDRAVEIPIG